MASLVQHRFGALKSITFRASGPNKWLARGMGTQSQMSTDRLKRDSMSLEEATISNMWEIAVTVEVL